MKPAGFHEWELAWGSPRGLFLESGSRRLEGAFLFALVMHTVPFGFLWHKKLAEKPVDTVLLQNVELIEPELEQPPAPPPVEVQKPKNALEFLKMAIPMFNKPAPEIPRDVVALPKPAEPKLAEPERLLEKKMSAQQAAPEIRLDANRNAPAPKIAEIAKLPPTQANAPRTAEPALKLEEVGRRAVPVAQTPSINLERARPERAAEIAALPQARMTAQAPQAAERLVEKSVSQSYRPPPPAQLGYAKRGAAVSLDQPREAVRAVAKPDLSKQVAQTPAKQEPATLTISRERVKLTGPLSQRTRVKSPVPEYPAWAKAQNVEADVAIRFTVSASGDVVSQVVERTSGYPQLDRVAQDALKQWKFSAKPNAQEEWGVITFRFLLE